MPRYEIRKVKIGSHDEVVSFPLDSKRDFDVYGVYEYKGEPQLLHWMEDFDTIEEAYAFLLIQGKGNYVEN